MDEKSIEELLKKDRFQKEETLTKNSLLTKSNIRFMVVFFGILLILMVGSLWIKKEMKFSYVKNLDKTVVKTTEDEVKLEALSYYIMIEEESVQEEALEYNPENPKEYWNMYVNQRFVLDEAKDTAMNYFLRDHLYFLEATADLEDAYSFLDKEKQKEIASQAAEIFAGLTEKQKSINITEENIYQALYENEVADEYVLSMADEENVEKTEVILSAYYGINSPRFKKMKKTYEVEVVKKLWKEVTLSTLTIN